MWQDEHKYANYVEGVIRMNTYSNNRAEYMLDIETMGVNIKAPIAAIGVCKFDRSTGEVTDTFYREVSYKGQPGRLEDQSTVEFWSKQSDEARSCLNGTLALEDVLRELAEFIFTTSNSNKIFMWGNSGKFDTGNLETAYLECGMKVPWADSWQGDSCFRVIRRELEEVGIKARVKREGVHHNALDDAKHQVKVLCKILSKLKDLTTTRVL